MKKNASSHQRPHPHNFSQFRILHWPYCCKCGLILLKNKACDKAAQRACPGTSED